jgi:putative methyltransferase (TIGR04325 family)
MARGGLAAWAIQALGALPQALRGRDTAVRRFEQNSEDNLFLGVFDSFEAAAASAPPTRPLGYDNPDSASLYLRRLRIDEYDYPALFWISLSLSEGMRSVADVGGAVGIKFFAFGKFLPFPPELRWRVIDVPAVARRGREFAVERGASASLEFSDVISDVDGFEVLFASGSLQYLPQSLPDVLAGLSRKPRRIVVNTTPIHPNRSFFTLNSVGTAFCPYRVQDREAFVNAITAQGYRLRDEWQNKGKRMAIPSHPEASLDDYSGFCFDAIGPNAAAARTEAV